MKHGEDMCRKVVVRDENIVALLMNVASAVEYLRVSRAILGYLGYLELSRAISGYL